MTIWSYIVVEVWVEEHPKMLCWLWACHDFGRMCSSQRRSPIKKNDYFRALPKLALPPPLIRATWSSFFWMSKTTYCAYERKSTDDDDDGWNDNYIGELVMLTILMKLMTKMTKKHTKIFWLLSNFVAYFFVEKANKFGQGLSPPDLGSAWK